MKKTTIKLLSLLCIFAMLLGLAACGNDTPAATTAAPTQQQATTPQTQAAPAEKSFTVTFDAQGGSAVAAQTVKEGGHAEQPADPTKDGFIFGGWATDAAGSTAYDFAAEAVKADVTLYAVWADASNAAVATFHLNYEGADVYTTQNFANESRISKPENPSREGFYFAGWFSDEALTEAFSDMKKYSGNQDFYAKWLYIYVLEAEDTQVTGLNPEEDTTATTSGNKLGYGRSGEAHGEGLIAKASDASGGFYIHGLYYPDAYLAFEITCDKDAEDVQIVVRLSAEFKDYELTQKDFQLEVNGKKQKYNSTISLKQDQPFADYTITLTATLQAGENVIRLVVINDEKQFPDGTVNAAAPMIDCIYLYTDAKIEMTKYNTKLTGH